MKTATGTTARAFERGALAAAFVLAVPGAAVAQGPLSYFTGSGAQAKAIAPLNWALAGLSIFVVVVISVLVLIAVFKGRRLSAPRGEGPLPLAAEGSGGIRWMYIGLALTTIALIGAVTWTMTTMAQISTPQAEPRFTIEITGYQWWWEVRYVDEDETRMFTTANEIHVPVGEPVRLKLASADVIHSFWVPAIAGKTDLIPGQVNTTWIQADEPGIFEGQCTEYCGMQHAHMQMLLFAQPREAFDAWWERQLQPAEEPDGEIEQIGQTQFVLRCGTCHTVRGTVAAGEAGPDLTHLMSRETIAAAMLPNTIGHLSGWIANPQTLKPGSKMPTLDISGPDLTAIRRYLMTLD